MTGFKPCYKWNTFNTQGTSSTGISTPRVLNLIINGIPSIHLLNLLLFLLCHSYGFKPYYKWNTFNTSRDGKDS